MGCCWHSRIAREETALSHCKARKRCMKHFVEARHSFSSSHSMYIRSLHTTASALVHFANTEEKEEKETVTLHHHSPTTSLPQPLPTSPVSDNALAVGLQVFMFFVRSLCDIFLLAGKVYNYGWILNPLLRSRFSIRKRCKKFFGAIADVNGSHCSTVERLYTLEKKLCQEAKHHQAQNHILKQLEDLNNTVPSTNPTSEIHRKSTLQREVGIQQWHQSFGNLFKAHRDYIQSLTAWLRLNLHHFSRNPLNKSADESKIYTLCEQWNLALDHTPDKVASKGIKSLLEDIHAIVVQQTEEHKQKKKLDAALKELQKKVVQLQSIECKHGSRSMSKSSDPKDRVTKKRAKVEHLRAKVEKEKTKHENSIGVMYRSFRIGIF
ncbi:Nitrate regulatory gene2 protein [Glycine max]|nr:Nitrate regulatory gene2 protein [Glycine max]